MAEDIIAARALRQALPTFTALASLLLVMAIAATLYLAREICVPLALGILLSFLLAPLVRVLQKLRFPHAVAVLTAVVGASVALFLIGGVVAGQLSQLAADLPQYRANMVQKIRAVRGETQASGALGRAVDVIQSLGQELQAPVVTNVPASAKESQPMPVEIREPNAGPLEKLARLLSPLLGPLATIGLVFTFTVFMLIQRQDIRNRFIRLAGSDDLQRTTAAMDDTGRRLSRLFLSQFGLNAAFGGVIGLGLWAIGVPSPVLWGILAAILRFIPYIGAVIAAALPLALAIAVDPGWMLAAWTAVLFVSAELVAGQAIEPLLFGHSTGLSPLAIVLAATFWSFLWGPIGLVLATPLTVALVVMGNHIERLRFLDVLLGDRPALAPPQIFYQRMLAADPAEAVDQALAFLKVRSLDTYYDEVALEGLKLAQDDIVRGALSGERQSILGTTIQQLVARLAGIKMHRSDPTQSTDAETAAAVAAIGPDRVLTGFASGPDRLQDTWRTPCPILCVAGRSVLDQAIARMLLQLFERQGLKGRIVGPDMLETADPLPFDPSGVALICFSYLDALSTLHIRHAARRMRRKVPGKPKVIVGLWRQRDPATLEGLRRQTSADALVTSLHDAVDATIAMATNSRDNYAGAKTSL